MTNTRLCSVPARPLPDRPHDLKTGSAAPAADAWCLKASVVVQARRARPLAEQGDTSCRRARGGVGAAARSAFESLLSVDCPGLYCFLLADSCKPKLSHFRWKSNLDPYSGHVVTRSPNLLFVFAATHYFASLANRSAMWRDRSSTAPSADPPTTP